MIRTGSDRARVHHPALRSGLRGVQSGSEAQHGHHAPSPAKFDEASAAAPPAAGHSLAADAPDLNCPIDLSDPYIVSALRALRDSGIDVGSADPTASKPSQPSSVGMCDSPAGQQQGTSVIAGKLTAGPAHAFINSNTRATPAAARPAPSGLGGAPGAVPGAFSGFLTGPALPGAVRAGPHWPLFAQNGPPEYCQRTLNPQAWQHMQQPMVYIPASALTHPSLFTTGTPSESSGQGASPGHAAPTAGSEMQRYQPDARPGEADLSVPNSATGMHKAGNPTPRLSSPLDGLKFHVPQAMAVGSEGDLAPATVASNFWGVQLKHFRGKY